MSVPSTTATASVGTLSEPPPHAVAPSAAVARTSKSPKVVRGAVIESPSLIAERVLGTGCGLSSKTRECTGPKGKPRLRGQTGLDDSIGQLERVIEAVDSQGDLALLRRVDHRRRRSHECAHLGGAEGERADGHATASEHEVVGTEGRELQLRLLDREQVPDRLRERAVAVLGRRDELAELVLVLRERDPPMEVDLERLRRHVRCGDVGVDSRVDPYRPCRDPSPARELRDRLVEHLDVELEPERGDVTRLLGAEEVAGAADLEVAHGDLETGAQLRVVCDRREASACLRRQLRGVRVEQVRVRENVRAAHAAADLVELREPEGVGALDDEGVRLRDVDPGLDDGGRDEDVRIAGEEAVHPLLELLLRHLPVRDEEAEARAELLELLSRLVDRLDAVVEVEGLSAPRVLALERGLDQRLVVLTDVRSHGSASDRRGLHDRDVAEARQRHVERPRDGRRGKRKDVDLESERAQELLLCDAEALFLVEHDEPEVLRDDVAREDAMRPDEDVDLALAEVREDA